MNERYLQMVWLADGDPIKLSAYDRMPITEYYILLNKKDEDIKSKKDKDIKKDNKIPKRPNKT